MKYAVGFAGIEDADWVDHHLSEGDRQEAEALGQEDNGLAYRSFQETERSGGACLKLVIRGRTVAVFGVRKAGVVGVPWLLGVGGNWRRILLSKDARTLVDSWVEHYGFLMNFISANNTTNIRFLKRLGFSISKTHGNPNVLVFHQGVNHV